MNISAGPTPPRKPAPIDDAALYYDLRQKAGEFVAFGNNLGNVFHYIQEAEQRIGRYTRQHTKTNNRMDEYEAIRWQRVHDGLIAGRNAMQVIADPQVNLESLSFGTFNAASALGGELANFRSEAATTLRSKYFGENPMNPTLADRLEAVKAPRAYAALKEALQKFWQEFGYNILKHEQALELSLRGEYEAITPKNVMLMDQRALNQMHSLLIKPMQLLASSDNFMEVNTAHRVRPIMEMKNILRQATAHLACMVKEGDYLYSDSHVAFTEALVAFEKNVEPRINDFKCCRQYAPAPVTLGKK